MLACLEIQELPCIISDLKRNTEARQIVGSVADIEDLVSHGMKSK